MYNDLKRVQVYQIQNDKFIIEIMEIFAEDPTTPINDIFKMLDDFTVTFRVLSFPPSFSV